MTKRTFPRGLVKKWVKQEIENMREKGITEISSYEISMSIEEKLLQYGYRNYSRHGLRIAVASYIRDHAIEERRKRDQGTEASTRIFII